MPVPRVLVLRAPGTNCDRETAYAFERAGAAAARVHVNRLLEDPSSIDRYQILCIPGGFCYGDDISAGKILASQLRQHLADVLNPFRDGDRLILGICNGFQVILKAGLLIEETDGAAATLAFNDSGRYEDRWVQLETAGETPSVFLAGVDRFELPVAHAEGKVVFRDQEVLRRLADRRQIALRYASANGEENCEHPPNQGEAASVQTAKRQAVESSEGGNEVSPLPYPANPNGSTANVAGLCDATGRVLGLMPHPERHIEAFHHPRWTRHPPRAEGDGMALFRNAVAYFR